MIPEPAVICRASLLPGDTGRLARWPAADEPDAAVLRRVERLRVVVDADAWPVGGKEVSAVGFDFAHGDSADSVGSGCDGKASKAGEEVETGSCVFIAHRCCNQSPYCRIRAYFAR
jgi:hypothetical protein